MEGKGKGVKEKGRGDEGRGRLLHGFWGMDAPVGNQTVGLKD